MTCIVAVRAAGTVYMGADSAGVGGLMLQVRRDRKICRNGPFLFGFTTSFRMGQLLTHAFSPPEHRPDWAIEKFMATTFVDAVRSTLKAGGFAKVDNSVDVGGEFLVGYKGRIFHVYSDFQVAENDVPYDACGSGAEIALGSLHALFELHHRDPQTMLEAALKAAETFNAGVRGPFCFEHST